MTNFSCRYNSIIVLPITKHMNYEILRWLLYIYIMEYFHIILIDKLVVMFKKSHLMQ